MLRSRMTIGPSLHPPALLRFDFLLVLTSKVMLAGMQICQQCLLLNLLVGGNVNNGEEAG